MAKAFTDSSALAQTIGLA